MNLKFPLIVAISAIAGVIAAFGLRLTLRPQGVTMGEILPGEGVGKAAHADAGTPPGETGQHSDRPQRERGAKGKAKPGEQPSFFKFSRQFVAPVVRDGRPEAMVILDVVLELSPTASEGFFSNEPLLRDAVLRALLTVSGRGDLTVMREDKNLFEELRAAILQNVKEVVGDDVRAVLLMDVAYQPF